MKRKLVKCGRLFDGIQDTFYENMEILIEEAYIAEIGKNLSAADAELIDLGDWTVTPGMIDAHVHLSFCDTDTLSAAAIQLMRIRIRKSGSQSYRIH